MKKYDLAKARTEDGRKKLEESLRNTKFVLEVTNIESSTRGFVFLVHNEFSKNIFLHKNNFKSAWENLYLGDLVEATVGLNKKTPPGFEALAATKYSPYPESDFFYNPYTFIPTPDRQAVPAELFAGDANPLEHQLQHDRMVPELWSGVLTVKADLITPLVLPSPDPVESKKGSKHFIYHCKNLPDASEIRGMLRSAYEIITNSRYCGFTSESHNTRLGLRTNTKDAIKLVPARVIQNSPNGLQLELLPGISEIDPDRGPKRINGQNPIMYAAWLDRYEKYTKNTPSPKPDKNEAMMAHPFSSKGGTPYKKDDLPQHKEVVYFKSDQKPHGNFDFLHVTDVLDTKVTLSCPPGYHKGYVCITGPNMVNKHYERIFFNAGKTQYATFSSEEVITDYELLIKDYRELHKDERPFEDMDKYLGHEPGKTGFSRHVWAKKEDTLKEGDLVFARVKEQAKTYEATAIYPVMMSRELYPEKPAALLPKNLKQAEQLAHLSPAERLFGWVAASKQKGNHSAYRGRIKVEIRQQTSLKADTFPNNLILPILGEPRVNNGRFYVAANTKGDKQEKNGTKLERGYANAASKGLRGRKAYWHHQGLECFKNPVYWQPNNNPKQKREYRGCEEGEQNRSLKQWLKPGQGFTFHLHLHNATPEEVGALLWMLSLDSTSFFRLGFGKPLGFGSLRLQLVDASINKGEKWRTSYYNSLFAPLPSGPDEKTKTELVESFQGAMVQAYRALLGGLSNNDIATLSDNALVENFNKLPFIAGFLKVTQGPGDKGPIHYPRTGADGKVFEWFGINENGRKEGFGAQQTKYKPALRGLPHIIKDADNSLPYDPIEKKIGGR